MYGKGGLVLPAATTMGSAVVATTVLPQTGPNLAVEFALSAAAGLAMWAVVYMLGAKFSKR